MTAAAARPPRYAQSVKTASCMTKVHRRRRLVFVALVLGKQGRSQARKSGNGQGAKQSH